MRIRQELRRAAARALVAALAGGALGGALMCPIAFAGDAAVPGGFDNPAAAAFREHRITAAIDTAGAKLTARDEILLVHPARVPAGRRVPFLLHRDLVIDEVRATWAGRTVPIAWQTRERWQPRDFWPDPEYAELAGYEHAREVELTLEKGKTWPESLWVSIRYAGSIYDSLQAPPENYQRGFETTDGLIDPRGVFLSGATLWYPQRFDTAFPFKLTVTVPAGWCAVSQGRPIRANIDAPAAPGAGDPARAAQVPPVIIGWDSPEPMDEIYLIAGPYTLREEMHRGIALQTFTYANTDSALCQGYLDATRDYLDLYGDLIGPYPFAKFALVENFWQTGYGMPSFTLLGDRVIRLPFIVHTSYGHEILHNWWGNSVFVDGERGNWCEGLTSYGADYLYKERESADAARAYRRTQLQGYLDYVSTGRDFPLTEFRERYDASSAALGYGKSMMIDHMLRQRLGDEAFWGALRDFYAAFRFRQATWMDLLGCFAARGGFDADAFHEQWIARAGAPLLTLAGTDLTLRPGGGCDLRYQLTQTEPIYDLAVPVRVTYADAEPETWLVQLAGPVFEETRALARAPLTLEVDPDFDLFRRLHRAEVPAALSQLFGADSVTIVIAGPAAPADGAPDSLALAWRAIADEARKSQPTGIVADADVVLPDLTRGGVWLFGEPRWMGRVREQLPQALAIDAETFRVNGESFARATHTLVCALPHPGARDAAMGLLLGRDAADVREIWKKLPHYGSNSYLVFEGTHNVAKGVWPVERSPLKVVWEATRPDDGRK